MIGKVLKKFYTVLLVFAAGCGPANRFDVSTGDVKADVRFTSWNKAIDAKNPEALLAEMKKTSTELYKYYLGNMIGVDPAMDSMCVIVLDQFMHFASTEEGMKEIKTVYGDFKAYEDKIREAFTYVKYHYPKTPTISVVTYHSGFNFGVFPVDHEIGVGLDMYLGADNKITRALPQQKFPQYIKNNMKPVNMLPDIMRGYAIINLVPENADKDLLGFLIYEGKALYALDAFMPHTPDHEKIRYTPEQYSWCVEYEKEIWKTIIDNKWLYDSNMKMIGPFINEGPFTSTLPQNSPPRAGAWLGWQMVRAYADAHPDLTLQQVLDEPDARKILRSYKPKK